MGCGSPYSLLLRHLTTNSSRATLSCTLSQMSGWLWVMLKGDLRFPRKKTNAFSNGAKRPNVVWFVHMVLIRTQIEKAQCDQALAKSQWLMLACAWSRTEVVHEWRFLDYLSRGWSKRRIVINALITLERVHYNQRKAWLFQDSSFCWVAAYQYWTDDVEVYGQVVDSWLPSINKDQSELRAQRNRMAYSGENASATVACLAECRKDGALGINDDSVKVKSLLLFKKGPLHCCAERILWHRH